MSSCALSFDTADLPERPLARRLVLIDNGWEPVVASGKAPVEAGWQAGDVTADRIISESGHHPAATSTGIRTGRVVAVDIDIVDPGHADAIREAVEARLGPTGAVRVGKKGAVLLYANDEPIPKIVVAKRKGRKDDPKVEILGSGQQVIAYGIHPDTGLPYRWIGDVEPATSGLWDLPTVTPDKLRALAEELPATLSGLGYDGLEADGPGMARPKPADVVPLPTRNLPPLSPAEITARLNACDPSCGRGEWRDLAAGLHAVPCTDAEFDKRELFVAWSRGGENYTTDAAAELVYDTMPPKPGGVGAGSFIRMTDNAGYRPDSGTTSHEAFASQAVALAVSEAPQTLAPAPALDEWERRVAAFRGSDPVDDANQPDPEFWDADHTLPKFPDGAIGLAYGESGKHKTTIVTAVIMAAIQEQDAHVVYFAGEGGYGLGKMRIPAVAAMNGLSPQDLRGRYRGVKQAPNLADQLDVKALIEAHRDFKPNIVVIDTLATAIPGLDENAASTGSLISGNGPAGKIKAAFNAAVLFVAHQGKDGSKGVRGTSAFRANSDFVWEITSDKTSGTARLHVKKMRDGPDDFSVFYRIVTGANGVPVARRISESEHHAAASVRPSKDQAEVAEVLARLSRAGGGPFTTQAIAIGLVPHAKDQTVEAHQHLVYNEVKRLQALARPKKGSTKPGVLAAFVVRDHRGEPLNPVMWELPYPLDDGGGDE